jgi:hypothetical protein
MIAQNESLQYLCKCVNESLQHFCKCVNDYLVSMIVFICKFCMLLVYCMIPCLMFISSPFLFMLAMNEIEFQEMINCDKLEPIYCYLINNKVTIKMYTTIFLSYIMYILYHKFVKKTRESLKCLFAYISFSCVVIYYMFQMSSHIYNNILFVIWSLMIVCISHLFIENLKIHKKIINSQYNKSIIVYLEQNLWYSLEGELFRTIILLAPTPTTLYIEILSLYQISFAEHSDSVTGVTLYLCTYLPTIKLYTTILLYALISHNLYMISAKNVSSMHILANILIVTTIIYYITQMTLYVYNIIILCIWCILIGIIVCLSVVNLIKNMKTDDNKIKEKFE